MRYLLLVFVAQCTMLISRQYYGEDKQDKYVHQTFFPKKKGGVFVDIGAHAGIRNSNTYFFEKILDWTGLCFEPSAQQFQALKRNRKCICVNAAVANENRTMQFVESGNTWTSGLLDKYDPIHFKKHNIQSKLETGIAKIVEVQCVKLNDLLEIHHIDHVHFLSIDTEGGELEILQSIDYDRYPIDVICVENHYKHPEYKQFLESKGYKLTRRHHRDEFYAHTRLFQN